MQSAVRPGAAKLCETRPGNPASTKLGVDGLEVFGNVVQVVTNAALLRPVGADICRCLAIVHGVVVVGVWIFPDREPLRSPLITARCTLGSALVE